MKPCLFLLKKKKKKTKVNVSLWMSNEYSFILSTCLLIKVSDCIWFHPVYALLFKSQSWMMSVARKKKKRSCLQLTASYLSISFCTTSLDIVNNILLCFHFGASMAWICISELKWSVVFCFCLLFFIILISIIQEFARNQLLFFLFHNFYLFALTIFITIIQFSDFIEASMTSYIF